MRSMLINVTRFSRGYGPRRPRWHENILEERNGMLLMKGEVTYARRLGIVSLPLQHSRVRTKAPECTSTSIAVICSKPQSNAQLHTLPSPFTL